MEQNLVTSKKSTLNSKEHFKLNWSPKKSLQDAVASITDHVHKKKKVEAGLLSTNDAISISKKLRRSLTRLENKMPTQLQPVPSDPSKFIVNDKHNFTSARHKPSHSIGSYPLLSRPSSKQSSPKLHLQLSEIKKNYKIPATERKNFELELKPFITNSAITSRPISCDLYRNTAPNSPRKPKSTRRSSQFCLDKIISECNNLENLNKRETNQINEEDKVIKSAFKRLNRYIEKPKENLNKDYVHAFVKDFKSDKIAFVYGKGNQGLYLRSNKRDLIKLL
ncbi:unnamed protein product [Blepharisma stoltei]|uniref:Uncharacterized protein n=1 Tax=Blepharisma stoltei TaxID=1481888 RepID=A0AAU9IPY2_9CILI|nr:unnamed protein product [Blepharisma stoltei]